MKSTLAVLLLSLACGQE